VSDEETMAVSGCRRIWVVVVVDECCDDLGERLHVADQSHYICPKSTIAHAFPAINSVGVGPE
jgi:hypothetical protein